MAGVGVPVELGFGVTAGLVMPGEAGWVLVLCTDFDGLTVMTGLSPSAANDAALTTSKVLQRENRSKRWLRIIMPFIVTTL